MIAKNKGDFLYNLHNELHRIGIDDDEEIFADFEEHFKASQEEGCTEEETCEKLGDVKEIARNYLDIQSTRINSIVAGALENQRRVSLTKPGEKLPADLSLVGGQADAAPAETPAIREYTPEHIAEETVPASPRINLVKPEAPAQEAPREYTPEHIACEPEAPKQAAASAQPSQPLPEYTPQHIAPEQPAPDAQSASGSIPKQTDERYQYNSTSRQGEVPPQCVPPVGKHAKDGGFKFSDVKGMKPNCNAGKLITCIVLDVLLWSWLIPLVISMIFGGLGSMAMGLLNGGFDQIFGVSQFHPLSRIFLGTGMISGAVLVGCGICGLFKAVFHWVKAIVMDHVKAIYGL